jgi:TonB family protein
MPAAGQASLLISNCSFFKHPTLYCSFIEAKPMRSTLLMFLLCFGLCQALYGQQAQKPGKSVDYLYMVSSKRKVIFDIGHEPVPINLNTIKRALKYPQTAKNAKIQGKVAIKMLINKKGIPLKHKVIESPHDELTNACLDQIYDLRFKPSTHLGQPVEAWVTIPFQFKLK